MGDEGKRYTMDCGDHSCDFALDRKGMRTNGGCRCLKNRTEHSTSVARYVLTRKAEHAIIRHARACSRRIAALEQSLEEDAGELLSLRQDAAGLQLLQDYYGEVSCINPDEWEIDLGTEIGESGPPRPLKFRGITLRTALAEARAGYSRVTKDAAEGGEETS